MVLPLVSEAKGQLFKNIQGRYFIYLPITLEEDSMFPLSLKPDSSIRIKLSFNTEKKQLIVEKWSTDLEKTQ
jgi:hypothetical protein